MSATGKSKRPPLKVLVAPPTSAGMRLTPELRARKQSRTFLHQLTSGIAGWLTFEQMRECVDNLREAELAKPLEEIAKGRGFEVKGEFPLAQNGRKGGPSRIDFLLVHRKRKIVIAIETKYKRKAKMRGSFAKDASKLSEVTIDVLETQIRAGKGGPIRESIEGFALYRAVMVIWHESDVTGQLKIEPLPIRKQFIGLFKALLADDLEPSARHFAEAMLGRLPTRPVATVSGALRPGSTFTYKRFWVACLFERPYWAVL